MLINNWPGSYIGTRPQATMRAHSPIILNSLVNYIHGVVIVAHLFNASDVALGELVDTWGFLWLSRCLSPHSSSSMACSDLSSAWRLLLIFLCRRFADLGICCFEVTSLIIPILLCLGCRPNVILHDICIIVIASYLLKHLILNISLIHIVLFLDFFGDPGSGQMIPIIRAQ